MYSKRTDRYTCDYCGHESKWDGNDKQHGRMWGCEKCGKTHFCEKCFADKLGKDKWNEMLATCDDIMCPDCYEKYLKQEA